MGDTIILSNNTEVTIRKGEDFQILDSAEIIFNDGWNYGHTYYIPKEDIDLVISRLIEIKLTL